ncbi:MAG: HAD family hydrolase [Candidatus Hodarchaeota archaeon]
MKSVVIVLDFDGTVANTMPKLEEIAVKLMTREYGLTEKEARTKYVYTTGLPFVQQIDTLFPGNPKNKHVVEQFEKEKIEKIFEQPLFPDAKETIRKLKEAGYIVCISSSTFQPTIEKYFKLKNVEADLILGYREGFEKGRDHFEYIKQKFGVNSDNLIFVGDSLKDAERAVQNNVKFIAKLGLFKPEEFKKIAPECPIINNLTELINKVQMYDVEDC